MKKQNKLILHLNKRETALKWLFFSFGYFALFAFLKNPVHETISLIGKEHIILFFIFCVVYSIGNLINLFYMKNNFKIKNIFFWYASTLMSALFGFVATTLMPDKSVGDVTLFATIAHWVFGFGGILTNTVCVLVFLLAFMKEKKTKALRWIFGFSTGICILDLLTFVGLTLYCGGNVQKSKNGFLEIVPMTVTYLVFYVINHTDLVSKRSERDEKEKLFSVRDESLFSAFSFGALGFAFIMFTLFAFVRNPIHFTISMTGTDYPVGFAVVSVSLACAFVSNYIMMFRRHGYKNILTWFLAVTGPLAIIICVIAPTKMGTELDLVHSVSALIFFYFILASFILYYFHFRKDEKRRPLCAGTFLVLLGTTAALILLFVVFKQKYGRTGLTEVIPLEFFFLCFLIENHTEYLTKGEKQKVA